MNYFRYLHPNNANQPCRISHVGNKLYYDKKLSSLCSGEYVIRLHKMKEFLCFSQDLT